MILFDPADWYWIVGADTTRVYSSKAAGYVPTRDPTYLAWQTDPTHSTSNISSEQELFDYLIGRAVNSTPPTATSTDAAKDQRIKAQLSGDAIWQLLFSHQNQILVLQGQSPITEDQFLTRVKGLMK